MLIPNVWIPKDRCALFNSFFLNSHFSYQRPIDEGGAITIVLEIDGIDTHILKGIASKAPIKNDVCDEEYALITDTTQYFDFIKKHEIEYRPTADINGKIHMCDLS